MRIQTLTSIILSQVCVTLATGQSFGQSVLNSKSPASATVVANELIFPIQHEHVHSSSIVELPDGTLLAAWFRGSGEKNADDVRVWGALKNVGAAEWGQHFDWADTPGHPD